MMSCEGMRRIKNVTHASAHKELNYAKEDTLL